MSKKLKILHLESIVADAELITGLLKRPNPEVDIVQVVDEPGYLAALTTFNPDVILAGYAGSHFGAVQAFDLSQKRSHHIPFIVITAQESEGLDMMKKGADDYLVKDRLARLPYAIKNAIAKHRISKGDDALKRSEANLSAVIENTKDLVYSLDKDLRFITYNKIFKDTIKAVYGFDVNQGECIIPSLVNFSPAMAEEWSALYAKALSGETLQFSKKYLVGDGSVYLSYSINPIWDADEVIGLSCFSRDVTRQKLDEEALKRSEANLSAVIENTTDLLYSLDGELRFITFNKPFADAIKDFFGWDLKQGDNTLDILEQYDPKEAQYWAEIYAKAMTGQALQFEKEINVSGFHQYISVSINPIWENNNVIGLSCFSRDITRQKMDEIALKKSEASLRTIFDNTDLAYILMDANLNILSFNKIAEKFSEERKLKKLAEGNSAYDYFDEQRRPFIMEVLKKLKAGEASTYQIGRQIDGVERWTEITWASIKHQDRSDFGYLITNKDITETKKLELEREKITADLIRRNKDLEQFTYIISHNLRSPLANIIGLSYMLADLVPDNGECLDVVNGIKVSANKLDEVISDLNQILQVSHLSEKNELVSLSLLIGDIRKSISYLFKKEHVKLIHNFTEAPAMFTLKSYLYSIFYNLILNSIKYRQPEIHPVISISSKVEKDEIIITYKDNGRGIDTEKNKKNLFGLYKRFDTSVEGKGMGLFMVKMQIESLGGSISLKSQINKGIQFRLTFPVSQLREG